MGGVLRGQHSLAAIRNHHRGQIPAGQLNRFISENYVKNKPGRKKAYRLRRGKQSTGRGFKSRFDFIESVEDFETEDVTEPFDQEVELEYSHRALEP